MSSLTSARVCPPTVTSPTSGRVTIPSGRTVTLGERSALPQTETWSTSPAPMWYSPCEGSPPPVGWVQASCAQPMATRPSSEAIETIRPRYSFFIVVTPLVQGWRSEEHTSELQSHSDLVCRLLLEKKKKKMRCRVHTDT